MFLLFLLPFSLASLSFPYILTVAYVEVDKLTDHPMWFHEALSEYNEILPTLKVSHHVLETSLADKYSKLLCPAWNVPFLSSALNMFYSRHQTCDNFFKHLFVKRRFLALFYFLNNILKPERVHRTAVLMDYPLYIEKLKHISSHRSGVEHFLVHNLMSQVLGTYEDLLKGAPSFLTSGYTPLLDTISQTIHKECTRLLERYFPLQEPSARELQIPVTVDLLFVLYPKWPSLNQNKTGDVVKMELVDISWKDVSIPNDFSKYFMLSAITCYFSLRKAVPNYTFSAGGDIGFSIPRLISDLALQRAQHSRNRKAQKAYTRYMESIIICGLINNQFSILEAVELDKQIQLDHRSL